MWKILGILGGVLVVVLLGIGLGLFGTRRTVTIAPPPPPVSTNDESWAVNVHPPLVWPTNTGRRTTTTTQAPTPGITTNLPVTPPVLAATNTSVILTNWEEHVDNILSADADDVVKARQMLQVFPQLPPEGQEEVAQHLANLTPDEDFPLLTALLVDPAMPETVQDVILGDSLNRPNAIKLPLLLEVASTPNHPKAAESRDILELFLEQDYGEDWGKWQSGVEQWLKDNPD